MSWKTNLRNPKNLGAINLRGGGIAKRGTGVALKTGGRASLRFGGGRTNLLEQLGRVEAEPSNPNRRAEISRVHGELNRGYAKGGRAGFSTGREVGKILKKGTEIIKKHLARKEAKKVQAGKDTIQKSEMGYAKGGRTGFREGTDKKWIQKAVDPKHKGYCTPMTKKTCTPARKALARTFKKKAKTGW